MRLALLLLAAFAGASADAGVRGSEQQVLEAALESSEERATASLKLCNICKKSLQTFMTNPVADSLKNSCDSFASNAADFTQCRYVWTARYTAVSNLRANGCTGPAGLVKPCTDANVICSALAIYPGAGKPETKEVYCTAAAGWENPFPGRTLPVKVTA